MTTAYADFLAKKSQSGSDEGFPPLWIPDFLFDFQKHLVEWAVRGGRRAIFADCGMGKTICQLVFAENVVRKTNKRVLILTPLAVSYQTEAEAEKFGVEAHVSRDGKPRRNITITNYEQMAKFDSGDFVGVVCDESSILKHFGGATQKQVTRFMSKLPYRLLCTATAAPNDYYELGTSSEVLGMLGHTDMLSRFFVQEDSKRYRMNEVKIARAARTGKHYARLAYRVSQQIGQWRLKGHAEVPFWRWVCSWARACRKPSDLGFTDDGFILPRLVERHHVITPKTAPDGMLFVVPAFGLREERDERRRTLEERCGLIAELADHKYPVLIFCDLNIEGDLIEKMIPDAVQVKGSDNDDFKEEALLAFASGKIRVLDSKVKIAGFGMNFQHCAHVITFANHSWERYYQGVRRCWRFGQKREVVVDVISTKGEQHVRDNMLRKSEAAAKMFDNLIIHMNDTMRIERQRYDREMEVPRWL